MHAEPQSTGSRRDRGRLILEPEDRLSMLEQLEVILGRVHRLEEHLTVAAARCGATCSPWTEAQLSALCDAAQALARAVGAAPPDGA